jgi:pimeloyl-ACP methyl ester carboxylesterase
MNNHFFLSPFIKYSLFFSMLCAQFAFAAKTENNSNHGEIIDAQEIQSGVPHSRAWKILYWSTLQNNTPVQVSGLVIAPTSSTPHPIVTWGHGTTGIAQNCAPSLVNSPASNASYYYSPDSTNAIDVGIPSLSNMIDAGYVVVATDYNGLGAPGAHEYLISETEARNMLDAAVAAKQISATNATNQIISFGWSQGGQASIWTAQITDYLSKEFSLVGAVSLAPQNTWDEIRLLEKVTATDTKLRPQAAAERMMGWYGMTIAYPELKLSDVLTPLGIIYLTEASKSQCAYHMADSLAYFERYKGNTTRRNAANKELWIKHYFENALGYKPAKAPLAVYQGDDDLTVYPPATDAYVNKACKAGTAVSYTEYKGVDHIRLAAKAEPDFLKWMADRFAEKPVANSCH